MPTSRDRPKICHCTPTCNSLLGLQQRRHHYRLVKNPFQVARSTTPETGESGDEFSAEENADMDIDNTDLDDLKEPEPDNGQENGDGFYDEILDVRKDLDFDTKSEVDEFLTLQEMQEALEDNLGPGQDEHFTLTHG